MLGEELIGGELMACIMNRLFLQPVRPPVIISATALGRKWQGCQDALENGRNRTPFLERIARLTSEREAVSKYGQDKGNHIFRQHKIATQNQRT